VLHLVALARAGCHALHGGQGLTELAGGQGSFPKLQLVDGTLRGTAGVEARYVAMTITSKTVAPREKKTVEELETALAKALRAHLECQGIKILKITPLENSEDGLANWDAEFAAEPGVTMSAECKRVLLGAKQDVQKHFDLSDGD